jgi:voltage-gated potassium channel
MSGSLTARRAAVIISCFTLSLTVIGAILVRLLAPDDFPSIGVALWWSIQTVTTVGYGDYVPNGTEGRIIGAVVMLVGVSFVAVVTASIAAAFVQSAKRRVADDIDDDPVATRLDEIVDRLERLERAVAQGRSSKPADDG